MDPIRIVIADDHPMVAEGIANMLRPYTHLHLVASYETGADLLAGLNLLLPDVLLLDIQLPDTTGNELARIIRQKYSKIKILVVTSIDNPFHIKDMLRQGCLGYVLKSIRPALLVTAIEQVYRGKIFLEEGLKEELLLSVADASGKTSANHIRLTKREQEILELVCEGYNNYEIGDKLFLSHRTVENHRLSLYQKFDVKNVASLVKVALQKGFV